MSNTTRKTSDNLSLSLGVESLKAIAGVRIDGRSSSSDSLATHEENEEAIARNIFDVIAENGAALSAREISSRVNASSREIAEALVKEVERGKLNFSRDGENTTFDLPIVKGGS